MKFISTDIWRSSVAGLALSASACVSAPSTRPDVLPLDRRIAAEPARSGSLSDVLTATELATSRVTSVADGVRQLRPKFIRSTVVPGAAGGVSVFPVVYVNGVYLGNLDVLNSIVLSEVDDIRLINVWQARNWWGSTCPCAGGVLHIRTKRAC